MEGKHLGIPNLDLSSALEFRQSIDTLFHVRKHFSDNTAEGPYVTGSTDCMPLKVTFIILTLWCKIKPSRDLKFGFRRSGSLLKL